MTWCLIRADASVEIGSGHIMRCLALANGLLKTGIKSLFVARHLPENLHQLILDKGHDVIVLKHERSSKDPSSQSEVYAQWLGTTESIDAKGTLQAIFPYCAQYGLPQTILCDHYALSAVWEAYVKKALRAEVVVIDDLSNRKHDVEILIDTTYGKRAQDYDGLVPKETTSLIGSKYAMLRPEFPNARQQNLERRDKDYSEHRSVKMLLISMGGMDKDNVSSLMLRAIAALPQAPKGLVTEVLVGPGCPHLEPLRKLANSLPQNIIIHAGTSSVAELLSRADLCIGAAGSSTWERCCLGVPTINVVIAENQNTIAKNLAETGTVEHGGHFEQIDPIKFAKNTLQPLLNSSEKRKALSLACREICDGRGVERLKLHFHKRNTKKGKKVNLRLAESKDIEQVYKWQTLPETRKYSNDTSPPKWSNHVNWMQNKLMSHQSYFYIIMCDEEAAGVVRLDSQNTKLSSKNIVSIFIDPDFFGLGIASSALSILDDLHKNKTIWAQIHKDNIASKKLFRRAGYIHQNDDWYKLTRYI